MKLAAHQISFQSKKSQNLDRILSCLENTQAQLHVFPEYCMGLPKSGLTSTYIKENAEQLHGPFVSKILEKTKKLQTATVFTTFLAEKNQFFNAAILAQNGKIKALYKKIHLFDALGYKESDLFSAGTKIAIAKIRDFRVGLAVCFDLRFPGLFRAMAYKGVDMFAVPSAWYTGKHKVVQWQVLTKARAHENNAYLIAVNQTPPQFTGNSLIASPFATTITQADKKQTTLTVELDTKALNESKKQIPTIKLSKPQIYKKI
jgi:predicted amidohydrolase